MKGVAAISNQATMRILARISVRSPAGVSWTRTIRSMTCWSIRKA